MYVINVQRKCVFFFFADVTKLFMINLKFLHGKEYVHQISCKNEIVRRTIMSYIIYKFFSKFQGRRDQPTRTLWGWTIYTIIIEPLAHQMEKVQIMLNSHSPFRIRKQNFREPLKSPSLIGLNGIWEISLSFFQVSMLKLWNTKISVSQYGMSVVKTKSDHCGGITSQTQMASYLSWTAMIENVYQKQLLNLIKW